MSKHPNDTDSERLSASEQLRQGRRLFAHIRIEASTLRSAPAAEQTYLLSSNLVGRTIIKQQHSAAKEG